MTVFRTMTPIVDLEINVEVFSFDLISTQNQGSTDRQSVRIGPRFSKICWSWSGLVLDFSIFVGPGPVRS